MGWYADGEGRPGLIGVRAAAPILFEVASLVRTDARFYMPKEELSVVAVCRKSGYRASSICPETDLFTWLDPGKTQRFVLTID